MLHAEAPGRCAPVPAVPTVSPGAASPEGERRADAPPSSQQFVTFRLGEQSFGVPVERVREIKGWQPTTALPQAPAHVLGVINLRGQVIAIHDLRQVLGLGGSVDVATKVVLVVDVGERLCGLVADAVSDIIDVGSEDLRPCPTSSGPDDPIASLAVRGDTVIGLLNVVALTSDRPERHPGAR